MKTAIYYCDRCKKEIDGIKGHINHYEGVRQSWDKNGHLQIPCEYDLCDECRKSLEEWMKGGIK